MKLVEFSEQTVVIAKNQPEYYPMPAYQVPNDPHGQIFTCWQLTWKERFQLLLSGKIWQSILTFNKPVQPQLLDVKKPFMCTQKHHIGGIEK